MVEARRCRRCHVKSAGWADWRGTNFDKMKKRRTLPRRREDSFSAARRLIRRRPTVELSDSANVVKANAILDGNNNGTRRWPAQNHSPGGDTRTPTCGYYRNIDSTSVPDRGGQFDFLSRRRFYSVRGIDSKLCTFLLSLCSTLNQ